MIFVNSMSDLFHEDIPLDYVKKVFDVMGQARHHTLSDPYQASREARRVGAGAAVAPERLDGRLDREPPLRASRGLPAGVAAAVRFISAEPLLGPLDGLDLSEIDWLIAGGESGPRHRLVRIEWLRDLRDRCVENGVAYFFKQWGGSRPKSGGRLLDGRTWDEMPQATDAQPA